MSWCRRGQDCSLYFRWKRSDADGKAVSGIKKHNKFPFEVEYLVMDPGYSELNRKLIEQNAK